MAVTQTQEEKKEERIRELEYALIVANSALEKVHPSFSWNECQMAAASAREKVYKTLNQGVIPRKV